MKNAIETKGIKKSFGKLNVLRGINLTVPEGSIVALLGPNGAGKTTMVRILSTLVQPDGGQASICGFDVVDDADDVRSVIGLTGQYAAIDEYLTGRENLLMLGRLYHLSKADAKARTEQLLKQFDLVKAADRPAKTYSGGMSRRLDLAASLIANPPVVFLDEPTTGLDPSSRIVMWNIIKDLAKNGSSILLTTQYLEEADQLANKIVVIDGGKVIADGTADQLKAKVGKERIEFNFAKADDLATARKIIKGKSVVVDEELLTLSTSHEGGVRKVRDLLGKLEAAKLKVTGMSLHKPTLDDVFLKLTGHTADDKSKKAG